jgi:hypothetical protein
LAYVYISIQRPLLSPRGNMRKYLDFSAYALLSTIY